MLLGIGNKRANDVIKDDNRKNTAADGEEKAETVEVGAFVVVLGKFGGEGGVGDVYDGVEGVEEDGDEGVVEEESPLIGEGDNPLEEEE